MGIIGNTWDKWSITLARDVFNVKYIIADFKAALYAKSKNHSHFSNQIKFLRYKLLLEMCQTVL